MPKIIYNRTRSELVSKEPFFRDGNDCTGKKSASTDQKITAAITQLSHSVSSHLLKNELRLSGPLLHKFRQFFARAIVDIFKGEYLRRTTEDDVAEIMERHEKLGFPGALGYLDFSGWNLHCGYVADQRRNIGNSGKPELRLESIVDDRLWIWHLKFRFPGALNDLNILDCSPLFKDVRLGKWPT